MWQVLCWRLGTQPRGADGEGGRHVRRMPAMWFVSPVSKSMSSLRAGILFCSLRLAGGWACSSGSCTDEEAETLSSEEPAVHRVPGPGDIRHLGPEVCEVRCPSQLATQNVRSSPNFRWLCLERLSVRIPCWKIGLLAMLCLCPSRIGAIRESPDLELSSEDGG